jgi:hypothetical protein
MGAVIARQVYKNQNSLWMRRVVDELAYTPLHYCVKLRDYCAAF